MVNGTIKLVPITKQNNYFISLQLLRVGDISGGNVIMSSLSTATGWRKVIGMGNVSQDTSWWLKKLKEGTYYWSVQAIDNSFAGGPFSTEDTFLLYLPIRITEQPENITTCPGDSLALRVSCNHFFPFTYQWYKNNIPITDETDSAFFVNPATFNNAGQYHCLISNGHYIRSTDTVAINITNEMAFHIDTYKPFPLICAGDSLALKMKKSYPFDCEPLAYHWFHDDNPMPEQTGSCLIISNFDQQDTGNYFCMASFNGIQSYSDTLNLAFGMACHLEKYQPYSLVCQNDSLVLKAKKSGTYGCEPDTYHWFRNNLVLPNEHDSLLIISLFTNTDAGSYFCTAVFGQRQVNTNTLEIETGPVYPYHVEIQQRDSLRCPGDSCSLKIIKSETFACVPDSCKWFKNNELLSGSHDTILRFDPLQDTDRGHYYCQVFTGGSSMNTDTLYLTYETVRFSGDSVFSNGNDIAGDLDLDDDWEIFPPLSLYPSYHSTNLCDIDRDGQPEHVARQDSVRFFKWTAGSWLPAPMTIPPAYVLRSRDLDNDGDADFLIHKGDGWDLYGQYVKVVFTQESLLNAVNIQHFILNASLDLVDIDNDQDFDIFTTGRSEVGGNYPYANAKIFSNNHGTFTEIPALISGSSSSTNDWGDYDNDGDLDLILSGETTNWPTNPHTIIYQNNNGSFSQIGFNVPYAGWVQWIDYDNDGKLDFRIGRRLFHQEDNAFLEVNIMAQDGLLFDYEQDGDLDILNRYNAAWWLPTYTKLFINQNCNQPNTLPTAPFNIQSTTTGDSVTFSWLPAIDSQTPSSGLSYNMRVGTTPGGCQIMSPMSNPSGFRQVVELGNVQQNLGWWLHNLSPGTYYWSVQAIDNSFAGGPFAPEQTFIILQPVPVNTSIDGDTVPDGQTLCFEATNSVTVSGNGAIFKVQGGGSVTMIAGENILFLPEVQVDPGGYLHGYITTSNDYCFQAVQPLVQAKQDGDLPGNMETSVQVLEMWRVNIYPNPTTGIIRIKIPANQPDQMVNIALWNLWGEKLLENTFKGIPDQEISLEQFPPGVYLIMVTQGVNSRMMKLVIVGQQ